MSALLLLGLLTQAQPSLKVVELAKPAATLADPFTAIAGVRELADGRVIVADVKDKVVSLVDFGRGAVTKIGREGRGPGEYAFPVGLVALPGDQTYVYDPMNQRFLTLDSKGIPGETVAFSSLSKQMVMMVSPTADATGRLYFQGLAADVKALNADSVPILRWTPKSGTIDTVAFFRPQKLGISTSGKQVKFAATRMFEAEEAWTVAPNGRVFRIVPDPYRVVTYDGPKPTLGPANRYDPIPVTEDEKRAAKKAWEQGMAAGRAATAAASKRSGVSVSIPEPEYAPTKPPFPGRAAAVPGQNGELWVERNHPFEDQHGWYDRFDQAGKLIGQIRLGPKSRILAVGKNSVYVVRTDEDELQYLERFRWP